MLYYRLQFMGLYTLFQANIQHYCEACKLKKCMRRSLVTDVVLFPSDLSVLIITTKSKIISCKPAKQDHFLNLFLIVTCLLKNFPRPT